MVKVTSFDERIMRAKLEHTLGFMSRVTMSISTEMYETEGKEVFYVKLDSVSDQCPSRDTLIVLVGFNATNALTEAVSCVGPTVLVPETPKTHSFLIWQDPRC